MNYKWNYCKNDVNEIKHMLIFFCDALFKVRCSWESFSLLILASIKLWRPRREEGGGRKMKVLQDRGELGVPHHWTSQSLFSLIGKNGRNCIYQQKHTHAII